MSDAPGFAQLATDWLADNQPVWSASYHRAMTRDVHGVLVPLLGVRPIDAIGRTDVLHLRRTLAARSGRQGRSSLSRRRLNALMTTTRQILAEGALQHGHANPAALVRSAPEARPEIQPFTHKEVRLVIAHAPPWWRPYVAIRFLSGLRTGEINGLRWCDVDTERGCLRIRVSRVMGRMGATKSQASQRNVPLGYDILQAIERQRRQAMGGDLVFTTPRGRPVDPANFTARVWAPLLRSLAMAPRRPYQTRHTAATLMLAAGENPGWIAHVLGHANTRLLFSTYSRYVPNLTRKDGSAYAHLMKEIAP